MQGVTGSYKGLQGVYSGLQRDRTSDKGYNRLQEFTGGLQTDTKGFEWVAGGYKGLQRVAWGLNGLQGVTRGYRVLKGVTRG